MLSLEYVKNGKREDKIIKKKWYIKEDLNVLYTRKRRYQKSKILYRNE